MPEEIQAFFYQLTTQYQTITRQATSFMPVERRNPMNEPSAALSACAEF